MTTLKTIAFLETDEDGYIEWSEGCICEDNIYPHSMELVDKKEVMKIIDSLNEKLVYYSWQTNPERMGQ